MGTPALPGVARGKPRIALDNGPRNGYKKEIRRYAMNDTEFVLETFDSILPREFTGGRRKGESKYPFATMPVGTRVRVCVADPVDLAGKKPGLVRRRIQQVVYGCERTDAKFEIRRDPDNAQYIYIYCVAKAPEANEQA